MIPKIVSKIHIQDDLQLYMTYINRIFHRKSWVFFIICFTTSFVKPQSFQFCNHYNCEPHNTFTTRRQQH